MSYKYSLEEIKDKILSLNGEPIQLIQPSMWDYYKDGVAQNDIECKFLLARSYYVSGVNGDEKILLESAKLYEDCLKNKYNEGDAKTELVSLFLQKPFLFREKLKKAYDYAEEVYKNDYIEVYIDLLKALIEVNDENFSKIKTAVVKNLEKQADTSFEAKSFLGRYYIGEFTKTTTKTNANKGLLYLYDSAKIGDKKAFDTLLSIYVLGGQEAIGVSNESLNGDLEKALSLIDLLDISPMSKLWQKNLICNNGKYSYFDESKDELHEIISLDKGAECIAKMNMLSPINANHILSYYIDLETKSVDKMNIFDLVYDEAVALKDIYEKTQSYSALKGAMLLADSNVRRDYIHAKSQKLLDMLLNYFEATKQAGLDIYSFEECKMISEQEFWDLNTNRRLLNIDVEKIIEQRYRKFRDSAVKYFKRSEPFKVIDTMIIYLIYNLCLSANETVTDTNSKNLRFILSLVKRFSKTNDKANILYLNSLAEKSNGDTFEKEYSAYLDCVACNFSSDELLNLRIMLYMISIYLWEDVNVNIDEIIKSFSFRVKQDKTEDNA